MREGRFRFGRINARWVSSACDALRWDLARWFGYIKSTSLTLSHLSPSHPRSLKPKFNLRFSPHSLTSPQPTPSPTRYLLKTWSLKSGTAFDALVASGIKRGVTKGAFERKGTNGRVKLAPATGKEVS